MDEETSTRVASRIEKSKKPEYIAAIVVNVIILIIVNQILNWGILPFLTEDFRQVLPIQNTQLAMAIAFNAAFLFYDPAWFTSLLRLVLNAVGIAVVTRYLAVFPFDFSEYADFDWAMLARVMLIIGLVFTIIAIIVEAGKFLAALMRRR